MEHSYTKTQITWLMLLRLFIGWHFMYEGLVKIMNPKWTSLPYLLDSKGFASDFFVKLTQDESLMSLVNVCNEWALFLIGLGLTLGCLYRLASVGGMILLAMYTLSHPSFIGATYLQPFEGSYLWIDKKPSGAGCVRFVVCISYLTDHWLRPCIRTCLPHFA